MTDSNRSLRISRRTVLAGAAAAGASHLVAPVAGLADAVGRRPPVHSRWVGFVDGVSPPIAVAPFVLAGVEWSAPTGARVELRARRGDRDWSDWARADAAGHGPDGPPASPQHFGDPIWTGPADTVQIRSREALRGVRLHFVAMPVAFGADAASAPRLAQPVLDAGAGQPPIIARQAWAHGAPPGIRPEYGTVKLAFVHHTENPNGYSAAEVPAMLLAIYQFHRFVRGWGDIGYNFVIDRFGRIWEARQGGIARAVIGAQAGGYNAVSTGVAVLGSFMDVVPSQAALGALERLLAWKLSLHGVPTEGHVTVEVNPADAFYTPFRPGAHVALPRVAGHRDGDSTNCPGNAFYGRLPSLRPRISVLAGAPLHLELVRPAGSLLAPATAALTGRLTHLHGPPVAGAQLEVQRVTAHAGRTLAVASTGVDGSWSVSVALVHSTLVQAVRSQAPAAVSDVVEVAVAPRIDASVASSAPMIVTGTVYPVKRRVIVDVHGGDGRLVKRKRVRAAAGRFRARLALSGAGPYSVVVRTEADRKNAAGASARLPVG